mmetsp:Transcript_3552/g.14235  ORF Transcript_3552/g.14235 Transcript_3552/m.14235 type:complete len:434 (-) Transcript_3552:1450-2751(-)
MRARARPVPGVRRDPSRRRVGRARRRLGRYQRVVIRGRLRVTRVGEGEVGSGNSVHARRRDNARAARQTRPRDRRARRRAGRGALRVGGRFRRRFEKNRRRFDSRVRGSSARARRRGARRFPGVQIDRPDDVAAIARRIRDAPGVSGSVSRRPRFTPRRPAPLAGRRRRRLTGARRDRRSGPARIRQDARSEVRYPPQRRRERVGVGRFTVRATGAGDVRDALPGSRRRARRCFRRGRRVERRRRVGIPDAPAPEACAVRGAEARRGADGGCRPWGCRPPWGCRGWRRGARRAGPAVRREVPRARERRARPRGARRGGGDIPLARPFVRDAALVPVVPEPLAGDVPAPHPGGAVRRGDRHRGDARRARLASPVSRRRSSGGSRGGVGQGGRRGVEGRGVIAPEAGVRIARVGGPRHRAGDAGHRGGGDDVRGR